MKSRLLTALVTILGITFVSCGGDDGGDNNGGSNSGGGGSTTSNIILRTQSISNGSEVEAASTTVLTLTYNTTVKVTSNADITLNGSKVTAKSNATTTMAVDIPLTLEDGTAYTVKVAKGAIVSSTNDQLQAPEVTVTFSTRAKAQPVNPNIASTPVVATTDAAKGLYSFLVEQYGKKIISSVMANVNWNNEEAERIGKAVGKYPAMNCYDFIHICYSPANWIDYTNISPVETWVKAGGLVSLMWHFNVPKTEGSVAEVTCTPSETTFRAKNVFTDGSWENKWFYDQMDKVVATLLKLQEAGIAATWRPFHEAAGNATHKQQAAWTKSWFWWGYDGADVYKKLWVTMFDYFQQKGVRNLIWVWTTQNYNGNSNEYNQDRDWYPGDQYVDIVARDLYAYTADQNLQEFTEIQATYPNKMVILGECGKDVNSGKSSSLVSDLWNKGAHWGSFMVWYGGNMEDNSWWSNALNDANVITRENLAK